MVLYSSIFDDVPKCRDFIFIGSSLGYCIFGSQKIFLLKILLKYTIANPYYFPFPPCHIESKLQHPKLVSVIIQ